ncbi:MAG: hypothetical protein WC414_03150 [Patescibacteria group bacterium]
MNEKITENSDFEKTVDEISDILKEETKKKNLEKKKPIYESPIAGQKILFWGVLFFVLLIIFLWLSNVYGLFNKNQNIAQESEKIIDETKQDLKEVMNNIGTKLESIKIEEDTVSTTNSKNEEGKMIENILNELKQINTSTTDVEKNNLN